MLRSLRGYFGVEQTNIVAAVGVLFSQAACGTDSFAPYAGASAEGEDGAYGAGSGNQSALATNSGGAQSQSSGVATGSGGLPTTLDGCPPGVLAPCQCADGSLGEMGCATDGSQFGPCDCGNTPSSFTVLLGGYVVAGPWSGYAWVALDDLSLGSAISPSSFETLSDGGRLCASGYVAPDPEYRGVALLGINLNQPESGGVGSDSTWAVTGTGISYGITNGGGSGLRIQITGAAGYPTEAWCAIVSGYSGTIAWQEFNTSCWDNTGSYYDGSVALRAAMVLVPGDSSFTIPFDFCLDWLAPV